MGLEQVDNHKTDFWCEQLRAACCLPEALRLLFLSAGPGYKAAGGLLSYAVFMHLKWTHHELAVIIRNF